MLLNRECNDRTVDVTLLRAKLRDQELRANNAKCALEQATEETDAAQRTAKQLASEASKWRTKFMEEKAKAQTAEQAVAEHMRGMGLSVSEVPAVSDRLSSHKLTRVQVRPAIVPRLKLESVTPLGPDGRPLPVEVKGARTADGSSGSSSYCSSGSEEDGSPGAQDADPECSSASHGPEAQEGLAAPLPGPDVLENGFAVCTAPLGDEEQPLDVPEA